MVLLLCLSFIGQTVASTVMYYKMVGMMEMNDGSSSQLANMSTVNNHCDLMMMKTSVNKLLPTHAQEELSSHTMSDELTDNTSEPVKSSGKCCEQNCDCFSGNCSAVAMSMKCLTHKFFIALPTKISSVCSLAKSQRLTSLYKPPIIS